jgi:heme/copper-type cytochrome/quinol oxidase subunit 3
MTPVQAQLVARRARLIRRWPVAGALMALAFAAIYAFAFSRLPVSINPASLATRVHSGTIAMESVARMAIIGSVAFIACGIFIFTLLFIISVSLRNESHLLDIIAAQEAELAGRPDGQPATGEAAPPEALVRQEAPANGSGDTVGDAAADTSAGMPVDTPADTPADGV